MASSYLLTCLNVENQFTTNILVDEENKSIFHLSSFNPNTKQKWEVKASEEVIFWVDRLVGTFKITDLGALNFKVYDLKDKTYSNSGHTLDGRKPFGQFFECFQSN